MNMKYVIKFASSTFGAISAMRALSKARYEGDRLRMADALISAASAAVAVAIIVRDIRAESSSESHLTDLEDHA